MNREEAIKIIDCYDIGFYDLSGAKIPADKLADAFDMAIEALSAEAKTKCVAQIKVDTEEVARRIKEEYDITDGWIPCSERLPDAEYGEGDSMLCCTESGLMYILYWNGGNWCASTGEPYHWVNHKTGWHDKVIAWMPLPKPYREGDEV